MLVKETSKFCFKCGKNKPLSMFYKHPRMADGHVNKCKECNKKDVRENRETNIEYYTDYEILRRDTASRVETNNRRAEKVKQRRKNDTEFSIKIIEGHKKWKIKNPNKSSAHSAISNALRDGKLVKPKVCEQCGKTDCTIYGHHWSYLPENWLNVMWLCSACHGREHRKYPDIV